MKRPVCRVYFITHEDGRLSGRLLRTFGGGLFDKPAPSAFGADEASVLAALEGHVARMQIDQADELERYLWGEELTTRSIRLEVLPLTAAHGRRVIGARRIPLQVTYVYSQLPGGGYRVMVPRLEAQLVLEDLSLAEEVLHPYLTNLLLGEEPQSLFDLRSQGPEFVREWTPQAMRPRRARDDEADDDSSETLRQVADDLVASARRGKLSRVVGSAARVDELARSQTLALPSLLLVGPPGVGKTAWVRALAQRLATRDEDRVPRKLWSSSSDRILAGLPYLGQWQQRCLSLVRELEHSGDLFYAERLIRLVQPQYEGTAIADFFDAALGAANVTLIAEATEQELALARRLRATFVSRFEIVRLSEPSAGEAIELLRAYAEHKAGPRLHPSSYRRLLRHLEVFARDTALPGKGLRFLDWLASTRPNATDVVLYPRDVSRAYAEWTSIPYALLADDEPRGPEQFANELGARVIGQPQACAVAGRVLARLKSAMTDPGRPCATLLFVGPTGVGKTELAKQLARAAFGREERLLRFDMSEYMYAGSAGRLLEASQGARSLVARVREEPRSLVLFDEIEKAHPRVRDLLLGALDEGRLTDANGRAADLRGTIMVMTSNLGVRDRPAVGFGGEDAETSLGAVRAHFRPELWNRIDYVVPFRPLALEDIARIVRLELGQLAARVGLSRRQITLWTSDAAVQRLATLGHDPLYGARPLKRVIEERVVVPIAARLSTEPSLRNQRFRIVTASDAPGEPSIVV